MSHSARCRSLNHPQHGQKCIVIFAIFDRMTTDMAAFSSEFVRIHEPLSLFLTKHGYRTTADSDSRSICPRHATRHVHFTTHWDSGRCLTHALAGNNFCLEHPPRLCTLRLISPRHYICTHIPFVFPLHFMRSSRSEDRHDLHELLQLYK